MDPHFSYNNLSGICRSSFFHGKDPKMSKSIKKNVEDEWTLKWSQTFGNQASAQALSQLKIVEAK